MNTTIKCPHCDKDIDISEALAHQVQEEVNSARKQLDAEKQAFEQKKKNENDLFNQRLAEKLKDAEARAKDSIRKQLEEENSAQVKNLQDELNQKSSKLQDYNKLIADNEKLQREKKELRSEVEAEMERRANQSIATATDKIRAQEQEKNALAILELQKKLEDQSRLTEEMRRKQEQGSMQLQGEVQELAIEEYLRTNFPLDEISEVKKGVFGADCRQVINTRSASAVGTIFYESKRTKNFEQGWVDKLRGDMTGKSAMFGVIVTSSMPKDTEGLHQRNGIWVCTFEQFKGLAFVLRESAILLAEASASQENKGDKMVMLYNYLTSTEFKQQIENIVDGFSSMSTDLEKEKRAMQAIWTQREKQIQKVILNTTHFYSSVKGIAGSSVPSIPQLQLGQ